MKLNEAIKLLHEHGYMLNERRSFSETHPHGRLGPARNGYGHADERPASDDEIFYDANELFKRIVEDFKKRPDTPIKVITNGNTLEAHEKYNSYFADQAKLDNIYRLLNHADAEYGLLSDITRPELEQLAAQYNLELGDWDYASRFFVQFIVYEPEDNDNWFTKLKKRLRTHK